MFKKIINTLFANPLYKVMALLFAVVLWSYVIAIEDPTTPKSIADVPVSFTNETALTDKNLVVRGDRAAILQPCDVSVEVKRSGLRNVTQSSLTATVNLGNISTKGEFDIPIIVTPPAGLSNVQISSRSPTSIHVEIDELAQKAAIPVLVELGGALPAGYYNGTAQTVPSEISLSGPKQDVERVSQAVVRLDLSRARGYNDSMMVELRDADGNVLPNTSFTSVPSVIVKMDVFPKKTVPIDQDTLIVGFDNIAPGYRLNSSWLTVSPDEIEVAGPQEILDAIEAVEIVPVDVQGWSESRQVSVQPRLPEGVIMTQPQHFEVYVDIALITKTVRFDDLTVEIRGAPRNKSVIIAPERISVTVTASAAVIDAISRGDIRPFVDVTDLGNGVYEDFALQTSLSADQKQNAVIDFSAPVTVLVEDK